MNTINKIVVIGGVGTALNILYQIKDAIDRFDYRAELMGIIIDGIAPGNKVGDFTVIGSTNDIYRLRKEMSCSYIFCLFRMDKMTERFELFKSYNISEDWLTNFIHPLAYVSPDVRLGHGNVVLSNSTIQAGVKIGNNNIFCSNITIEHNSIIGKGNFLSANSCIGAHVNIGDHCFIGLNSSVRENTILGNNVFVGMHSLVINNLTNCRVAGVPAIRLSGE